MSDILAQQFRDAQPVTQSDTASDPNGPFDGFYVGGAGNVKVTTAAGTPVTFNGLQSGQIVWCQITQVWETGTTGSLNILGLVARRALQ